LKEPAVLQGFYKILWWKHPVELTGKDLHYIFSQDEEIWQQIQETFGDVVNSGEDFYLSAEPHGGEFMLFTFVEGDIFPIFFTDITDEELYKIKSVMETAELKRKFH